MTVNASPAVRPRTRTVKDSKPAGLTAGRQTRLYLRATSEDKERIERAAQLRRLNVSAFVLQASRAAADVVIGDQTRFVLPPEQYEAFHAAVEAPARDLPVLAKLFRRGSVLG